MYSAPRGMVLFDRLTGQTWSQLFSATEEEWMNRLSSHPIKSPLPDPPKSPCLGQARSCCLAEGDGGRSRVLAGVMGAFCRLEMYGLKYKASCEQTPQLTGRLGKKVCPGLPATLVGI